MIIKWKTIIIIFYNYDYVEMINQKRNSDTDSINNKNFQEITIDKIKS